MGAFCVLHCVCEEVPFPTSEFLHSDRNPNEDVTDEELGGEVDHALHCHRDSRCVLMAHGMLKGEDRPDHSGNANVDRKHDQVAADCQDCSEPFVVHRILDIAFTFVTLLDRSTQHQWNCHGEDALKHNCVRHHVKTALCPPLWS